MINDDEKQIDNVVKQVKKKYDKYSTADLIEIKKFLDRVKQELPFNISKEDLMRYYKDNAFRFKFNHIKSKDCNKQVFLTYRGLKEGSSFSYIKLH
jgi:uncharacterized protein YktA (UPF0223 family)